jgi:hypothetical protein
MTDQDRWFRKQSVADRYDCDTRTVDRMARDGRIPKPHYLQGSRIPRWSGRELEASDRAAARARPALPAA